MPEGPVLPAWYHAVRHGVAAGPAPREVVGVEGPDATSYLQGQLSQDVEGVPPGGTGWAWLLAPSGKVDALVRVTRAGAQTWLVDTDAGYGARVAARLGRFKLRTKAEIALLPVEVLALRGPGSAGAAATVEGDVVGVADASWGGVEGVDVVGRGLAAPPDAAALGPDAWPVLRVETGQPAMGAELSDRTIPAETGLVARTVSFTKGCYTGQELVARIDSRGSHVPRLLHGFLLDGPASAGDGLRLDADAGTLTTVTRSPALGWVGLGYLRRGMDTDATFEVAGGAHARAVPLPLAGGAAGGE